MNGASDQPEEFGVQPEQGRQEEPQSNADSTSDATASPEDSTSSAPHSRRVRRRMSAGIFAKSSANVAVARS